MCLVTVALIAYNQEKYIAQAVNGILSQQVDFEYEILIGDDHSTDGTTEILRNFQEQFPDKIRLFVREKNVGASKNLYLLFAAASGKYIAAIEGDDYWCDEHKLRSQVEFLENHPEFIGCCGDSAVVKADGTAADDHFIPWIYSGRKFKFNNFRGIFLPGQTSTMMYRNIFSEYAEMENMYKIHPQISDRTLVMLYSLKGSFFRLNRRFSCYRQGADGSVTDVLYEGNAAVLDYEINEKLAKLASQIADKRIRFSGNRLRIMGSVLLKALLFNNQSNKQCLKEIISRTGKVKFWFTAPLSVLYAFAAKARQKVRKLIFNAKGSHK